MNSNFRYFCFSLLLLAKVATPVVATAQQAPIINIDSGYFNDRIFQIETVVNSQGKLLYQIQQQLLNIHQDIDILRDKIQKNQYQLSKVIQQQKNLYMQLDSLVIGINDRTKTNKSNSYNINNSSTVNNSNAVKSVNLANEKNDYDSAVALAIRSKSKQQIIKAITYFEHFIKTYPKSNYQSNANYWLGQLNYNQGNKDSAAFYFATVVKNYPNSSKVAESLYKIGLLMQEKGYNDKARIIYQQVIKVYPGTSSAQMAEKKIVSL